MQNARIILPQGLTSRPFNTLKFFVRHFYNYILLTTRIQTKIYFG